jgi:hypothetical protein
MFEMCEDVFLGVLIPFLNVPDLGNMACVSHKMRAMIDDNKVWRRLYLGLREKNYRIGPNSVHEWPQRWYSCQRFPQLSKSAWENAGRPCNIIHHYKTSSLEEEEKRSCVNYRNFKRAYARMVFSRISKFTLASERNLKRLRLQEMEIYHRLAMVEEEIERVVKRRRAPSMFNAILSLPPSTPPHLSKKVKRLKT